MNARCFACGNVVMPENGLVEYHVCKACLKDNVQVAERVGQ